MTGSIQILYVQDDEEFADLTTTSIRQEDERFAITSVRDARSAQNHLAVEKVDCVVSDYNLPEQNGIELLNSVRKEYPDLPFILFTGEGNEEVASEAISAGVTDYFDKHSGGEQFKLLANRIASAVENYRRQHSLERQKDLFKKTQELANVGAWEHNLLNGEIYFSDEIYDIYGVDSEYEPDPEADIERFYHPNDRDTVREATRQAVEVGEAYDIEVRITAADGSKKWVRTTGEPTFEDGECVRIRGTIQDITEQADQQRELQLLRQSIDDADVSMTLADPSQDDQPLVYVNNAFEELTGYSANEVLGRNCRFLQGEDTDPAKVATLREAINNEEQVTVDISNYRKDGEKFWNRLAVKPIYDESDRLVRYLGTQKDITTRKRRTEELIEERRLMNQAFNTLDDLFYVLDENGCFQRWNNRVPEVTGYSDAELSDMHALDVFSQDESPKIADVIKRVLNGHQVTVQADLITADNLTIPFELSGAQLTDSDGTTTGLVGIGRDITERKERQEYLELVGRVLRHNLRNDMNIIRGQAEILCEELTGDNQILAEKIIQISDDLTNMAEKERELADLLQEDPNYTKIDINQLLKRIKEDMHAKYPSAKIEVTCPDNVSFHASTQFGRAIEEIITNAIVHNDAPSPEVSVEVTAGEAESVITIADNGPPIPEMEREILMDGGNRTPLYHASGLGMSLIRLVVTRSGGTIRFAESPTTGNKVILEIPDSVR